MRHKLLIGLVIYLAVSFFIGGAAKFYPDETFFGPPYSEKFVSWGYPAWFRFVVGAGEIVAEVLFVVLRLRYLGAGLLIVIMTGATLTHIAIRDELSNSVSAPTRLMLSLIVAWAYRSDFVTLGRALRPAPQRPVAG